MVSDEPRDRMYRVCDPRRGQGHETSFGEHRAITYPVLKPRMPNQRSSPC